MSDFENKLGNQAQSLAEADATLRLIAQQPAPEGLAGRVHTRLELERSMLATQPRRRGFWRLWLPAHRLQFAGAAVVAAVIAVATLSVRHPGQKIPQSPLPVPAQSGGFGTSFGTSAAQGHPASLTPIPVPAQTKKKKPSAGHSAKHAPKTSAADKTSAASQATTAPVAP